MSAKIKPIKPNDQLIVFSDQTIRRTLHKNAWWFAIVDVVAVLTDSSQPAGYIKDMRKRDKELNKAWKKITTPLAIDTSGGSKKYY